MMIDTTFHSSPPIGGLASNTLMADTGLVQGLPVFDLLYIVMYCMKLSIKVADIVT